MSDKTVVVRVINAKTGELTDSTTCQRRDIENIHVRMGVIDKRVVMTTLEEENGKKHIILLHRNDLSNEEVKEKIRYIQVLIKRELRKERDSRIKWNKVGKGIEQLLTNHYNVSSV